MGNLSKKRENSRKTIHQPVSFELSELKQSRPGNVVKSGLGMDISSGGMGLTTDCALREGDVLKLLLPVAAMAATLPVFAEVIWSRPADSGVRAGLRFLA